MRMSRREMLKAMGAGILLPELLAGTENVWGQGRSSKRALALTIGLNSVDPDAYGNWSGDLAGCVADARTYAGIAKRGGFEVRSLETSEAKIGTVAQHILWASQLVSPEGIFLVAYAGHGSQATDTNGDETDGKDDTWCLFDGQLVDDELYRFWSYFPAGARILVVSDSCHSGTVARVLDEARTVARDLEQPKSELTRAVREAFVKDFKRVSNQVRSRAREFEGTRAREIRKPRAAGQQKDVLPLFRVMPEEYRADAFKKQRRAMESRRSQPVGGGQNTAVNAIGLLLAGCQEHQLSMETGGHGLFTAVLERALQKGPQSYHQLLTTAAKAMPSNQQPNFFVFGGDDPQFSEAHRRFQESQKPFSV